MRKIKIIAGALLGIFMITSVHAGSFGLGGVLNVASVSADGTETEGASGAETENSVRDATAGNKVFFGSVYGEYAFGEGEHFVFGIEHIPYSADVNSETLSRTDTDQGDSSDSEADTGTVKANAEISDHTTYYIEAGQGATGLYGKLGYSEVDIKVKQTNDSGYGTYPDKSLNAITYAVGYRAGFGENGVIKVEGYFSDYDSYSATSTTSNTVSADLDVVGAKLMVGYKF